MKIIVTESAVFIRSTVISLFIKSADNEVVNLDGLKNW